MESKDREKRALVTGGSRGIGRGIALELAGAGYRVAIAHWRDDDAATETAKRIREMTGRECPVIAADLAEPGGAVRTLNEAAERLEGLEALVNNAGISRFAAVQEMTEEHIDRIININFRSPLLLMREAARLMIANGTKGGIVNITSSRAQRAYPGDAVYGGLKAALQRATESAALDLAPHGIRVNAVGPGATEVRNPDRPNRALGDRIPLGRMGMPADIGKAVAWLLSPEASYVTGIGLRVDGGLILPGMPE